MNIIKLKDIVMPSECRFSKFFNENLKGKYAYWIQMRYIFPLESLDYKTYIKYEQFEDVDFVRLDTKPHIDLYDEECNMYNFVHDYIDHDATEIANAISDFRTSNDYVADADIDITKLRKFRTWLATEILAFNTNIEGEYINDLSVNHLHMLEYYKNNMYNDLVKYLSVFGDDTSFSAFSNTTTGCACCNGSTLYNLTNISSCNALDIYKKNIHKLMVQTFSDVTFWTKFNKDFIAVFKKYIDNIIKTGLIISLSKKSDLYIQCNCNDKSNNAYELILRNLSEALEYIINDEIKGHSNFIYDALYNWADQLYDHMSWEI
jgi:hypothetical protein